MIRVINDDKSIRIQFVCVRVQDLSHGFNNKISESSSQSLKHNMMSKSPKKGGKTYGCILVSGLQLVMHIMICECPESLLPLRS